MNSNSSLFGDLLDGRLGKEDEVHLHLDDNFLAGPVDTDAHTHINDNLSQQWRHHSNNHINITDQEDNSSTKDGKGKGKGVSPPKMVFNSLGVMELEHRFTGGQSITTPSNPTSLLYSSTGDDEEEESSSSDDDDTDFIYEVDRHDHLYSTTNNNTNNTMNSGSGRYQTTNFLDTASSIIDNLPVFNNSGNYTGTTSRECNIDDLEYMGNDSFRLGGREGGGMGEGVSYESTSTIRYKKLQRKYCRVGIVLVGLVGIVLGIYYGKGGTSSSQQDNEKQFDRYYQIGSEDDGIVVSDGVELVEGMVSIYCMMCHMYSLRLLLLPI